MVKKVGRGKAVQQPAVQPKVNKAVVKTAVKAEEAAVKTLERQAPAKKAELPSIQVPAAKSASSKKTNKVFKETKSSFKRR